MAVQAAMLTAVSQKERNTVKFIELVALLPRVIQALFSLAKTSTMEDADADIDDVSIGDRILGKVGERGTAKEMCNKELKTLGGMPLKRHQRPIGGAVLRRHAAVLGDEPCKHLAKHEVGVLHANLFVRLFEEDGNKVEEGVDEGRVHFDDVVSPFVGHGMGGFDSGAVVQVNGACIIWDISHFGGERIVLDGICLIAGIVCVEGGVDGIIKEVYFLGDG